MKSLTIVSMFLMCWSGAACAGMAGADVKPEDLRCEYLKEPVGIDVAKPRLSWVIKEQDGKGTAASPGGRLGQAMAQRGIMQSSYQILVATSDNLLKEGEADLWDSGKVASDQSIHVEYAGKPLTSAKHCFWKVKVWVRMSAPADAAADKGRPASDEAAGSWSEAGTWTMGMLKPEDFKGKWIGAPTGEKVEPVPMFRKTFSLGGDVKRATAYICGLGYYELSINGAKVGDHELDPKYTRYDRRALYVGYDVTDRIKNGNNAVGIILGNGWYNYHVQNAWDFHTAPWRAKPEVLMWIEVEYADGATQAIVTDESWKYSTGPIRYDAFMGGERYDARLEKAGWDTPGYDDSGWVAAKVVDAPKGRLSAQMIEPIRVTEVIKPVKVTQPKPGVFLYDFGQNMAGKARLIVSGPAGTDVKLQYGELLNADGSLNQNNINPYCSGVEFQTDHYILKGGAKETWQSRFMYHGFQYVQVTGFPGEPKLENIEALVMHSDLRHVGSFECSNELLNRIQQCTRWSYLNNFHGYPTDCPNRERNGWTGDAQLAAEAGLYNFDPSACYTQWMLDFKDEQRDTGELPGIVPTGGWGYKWGNGPAWDSAYILIPWYMYQYRGDVRILAEHYERQKRYVDYLTTKSKEGIVGIGLGDWCPATVTTPADITSTGYYYVDAVIVSKVAAILGNEEDSARYAALAEGIRKAFNKRFLNRQNMQYSNGSQAALSCALYQGLVEPADVDAVMRNLVADVTAHGDHLSGGILCAKYLMHVLADNGRADVAFRIAAQTTFPSWGDWLNKGATTLWENWNGDGTHNHIMFGDISAWFYDVLGGIQPDPAGPGFKKFIIRPSVVGDLNWVKCAHESMYGRIVSNWRLDAGKLFMDVTIPPNSTATVFVPAADKAGITESGKPMENAEGVRFLRMENGAAVFEVGSGSYQFCSERK